ncbi:hypothetical protein EN781_00145 [Mesorhizobium sp. M4A.F.Ca.ET.090.04.2.1]|uniref:hypothetical protein n=1 Tax=Mesorhizobium sp. M4A.F.Ca.ET.090.04.2.1 TaxID=2496663 RepID=UPI000FCBF3DC|nr:hypothetical protein [Mesorhizobium sp. M4A.F.Ca.ET.090.04.2.1]RVC47582.1 hypothetical protein EN781_00145 [Mesorhizobium sp. M4A.F.Ca.ET.090.04.2.1]
MGAVERRSASIAQAFCRHAANEEVVGRTTAIDEAVAEMIGAVEFLAKTLGKTHARRVVAAMLEVT